MIFSHKYAEIRPATGEVVKVVSLGEADEDYALSLMSDGSVAVELSEKDADIASVSTCYWEFDAQMLISAGTEPFDGACFDFAAKQWIDGRTLEQVQNAKWQEIKERRTRAEEEEYVWRGIPVDSNLSSRMVISNAVELARLEPGLLIDFTAGDNQEYELGLAELQEIMLGIARHVNRVHAIGRELRSAIFSAATIEKVKEVTWPVD